jgi:hypothetical protein
MIAGCVDNGGKSRFSWQFTAQLCYEIERPASMLATPKTGLTYRPSEKETVMKATADHTRNGSISATCTNDERAASFVEARP